MNKTLNFLHKYPRTPHLPHSPGSTNDDKIHKNVEFFDNKEVVVTLKMDGENTSIYNDYYHARSLDSNNHVSRDYVKNLAYHKIYGNIPEFWRICGENLYAKHSIHYKDLESYFYGFSIWDNTNTCLSWNKTLEWFDLLEIHPVQVIYHGIYNQKEIDLSFDKFSNDHEGYVIRLTSDISYNDFEMCFAKYVRSGHVQPDAKHWLYGSRIVKNELSNY